MSHNIRDMECYAPRRYEIIKLLSLGCTPKEIQSLMCIAKPTFYKHLTLAKSETGARTTEHLISIMKDNGL